jgi:hypothetical protein
MRGAKRCWWCSKSAPDLTPEWEIVTLADGHLIHAHCLERMKRGDAREPPAPYRSDQRLAKDKVA